MQAQELLAALQAILDLPKLNFPAAVPPTAPDLPDLDAAGVRRRHEREARNQTSVFARAARRAALAGARARAAAEVEHFGREWEGQRSTWQQDLDAEWAKLQANDPATVVAALARAFEDNQATAAPLGVEGDEVSLVVVVGSPDAVPERHPTTTAKGNLSLKKHTKRETADLYKLLVAGLLLVTVKETFAVAPSVKSARIVALRFAQKGLRSKRVPELLVAATLNRETLRGAPWQTADAVSILNGCNAELVLEQKGASKELHPLDLKAHPGLQAVLDAVSYDDELLKGQIT